MKKIVTLAPCILQIEGHDYDYHRYFTQATQELAIPHTVYYPKEASIPFSPSGWEKSLPRRQFFMLLKFFTLFLFRKKPRIWLLESYKESHLRALSLAARFFGRKKDEIWLVVRDVWKGCGVQQEKASLYVERIKKRTSFLPLTDSALLLPYLEKELHCTVQLLPVLFLPPFSIPIQKKERIRCLFHGKPKKGKGACFIHNILNIKDLKTKEFEIVFSLDFPPIEERIQNDLQIRCFEPGLPRDDYLKVLEESDILFFPYLPEVYRFRTSGIFVEAICMGKMVVVHEGTWLASELRQHELPECIVDWTNPLFFTHLHALYQQEVVWEKLKKMQACYQKRHSLSALKHTLKLLIEKVDRTSTSHAG